MQKLIPAKANLD